MLMRGTRAVGGCPGHSVLLGQGTPCFSRRSQCERLFKDKTAPSDLVPCDHHWPRTGDSSHADYEMDARHAMSARRQTIGVTCARCLPRSNLKTEKRLETPRQWVVGRRAHVTAKCLRYAAGSPASARHARAEAPHEDQVRTSFQRHRAIANTRRRGLHDVRVRNRGVRMFAANTQFLLGHMEERTAADLDHPGQRTQVRP